ncbi:TonB-dependent receptor plug domain-containing protein, partial [Arenibaculum pallidiluteum]|uniref:TonB-dependent receptor plug domain-containing protein n=1 Tax=Arenibaculum pallidiluteum TaxID=2812559 RepID=UPI001A97A0A0
ASDAPVSMEIISADDIRRTGATNIPDILQQVVGMDVQRWGVGAADVAVRGYNAPYSPRLLVLVNGRQVYLDHYGMTSWNVIPVELSEIRQIEVVKGPNTALFGFNAVGGVVNIITYNPLYDDADNVTARIGTQGHREVSGVTTFKLGEKVGVRLSAGGYNADEFDTDRSAAERARWIDPSRRSAAANVLAQVTPDSQLGVELTKSDVEQSEVIPVALATTPAEYDTWSGKATYTVNTGLGLVEGTVYRNQANVKLSGLFELDNTVTVAKVQDLFKVGTDHSFRVSGEFRRNELGIEGQRAEVSYDVYSVGGMWDWAVTEKLSLVNAVRLDHLVLGRTGPFATAAAPYTNDDYDRTVTEPSLNSGVVFKATDKDTFRVTFARGVQVPSLLEYGLQQSRVVYGNPDISPTIVTNYELGYERAVAEINGSVKTSVYYQTNDEVKARLRAGFANGALYQTFDNVGDSSAIGFEASAKGKLDANWGWNVGYAFESVKDDLVAGAPLNFEDATPRHKVNAGLGYTRGAWEANVNGTYVSSTDMLRNLNNGLGVRSYDVPSYALVSARVGYELNPGTVVALSAFDLLQDEQRLNAGPAEERRVYLSLSSSF